MLIDPFTTIAQIVNFLILVALLKKFLYRPIIEVMEQREKRIALRLQEADERVHLARQEAEQYLQAQEKLRQQKDRLLREAAEQAQAQKELLMAQAKAEVEIEQDRWHEALQHNQEALLKDFRQQVARQLVAIARRALKDLGNASLEQQIVTAFISRLQELNSPSLSHNPGERAVIRSSFPLTLEDKNRLVQVLERLFERKPLKVSFTIAPDAICGLELRTQSYKLAWNLGHYLDELEAEIKHYLALETAAALSGSPSLTQSPHARSRQFSQGGGQSD